MKTPKFTVKLLTKFVSRGGLPFMDNTVHDLTEYKQACPHCLYKGTNPIHKTRPFMI